MDGYGGLGRVTLTIGRSLVRLVQEIRFLREVYLIFQCSNSILRKCMHLYIYCVHIHIDIYLYFMDVPVVPRLYVVPGKADPNSTH